MQRLYIKHLKLKKFAAKKSMEALNNYIISITALTIKRNRNFIEVVTFLNEMALEISFIKA